MSVLVIESQLYAKKCLPSMNMVMCEFNYNAKAILNHNNRFLIQIHLPGIDQKYQTLEGYVWIFQQCQHSLQS